MKNNVIEYVAINESAYKARDKYNKIFGSNVVVNDMRYRLSHRIKLSIHTMRYFPYTYFI